MKKSFYLLFILVLSGSIANAHPGHNVLDHSSFHYLFSADHGLWIVIISGLLTTLFFSHIFIKSQRKHA